MEATSESDPIVLDALQKDIYREKVKRAQAMTVGERLASAFECSDLGLEMMFSQIRSLGPTLSDEQVWTEAGARIERVRQVRERPIFHNRSPRPLMVSSIATLVVEAIEAEEIDYMLVGAYSLWCLCDSKGNKGRRHCRFAGNT